MKPKHLIVAGLFVFAFIWVTLMALGNLALGALHDTEGVRVGGRPFTDDGTVKAEVASLHRDNFHLTLTMNVTGPDGKLIGGLGEDDIEVTEDGKPVAVTKLVPAGQAPIRVALVIDYSGSMKGPKIDGAKKAALALLDMLRDHRDHLGLYFFNNALVKAGPELLPMGPLDPERRAKAVQVIQNTPLGGGTPMYETMEKTLPRLEKIPGRRIMIVMTDGQDTQAKGAAKDKRVADLLANSEKMSIPYYMVSLEGGKSEEAGMKKLAGGGKTYLHAPTPDKLKDIYVKIGETLQNEYVVEWDSPNPIEDGSNRKVVVTVRNGPSGTLARTAYQVPGVYTTGAGQAAATGDEPGARQSPPFLGVVIPLGLLLTGLFVGPYLYWLRPKTPVPTV